MSNNFASLYSLVLYNLSHHPDRWQHLGAWTAWIWGEDRHQTKWCLRWHHIVGDDNDDDDCQTDECRSSSCCGTKEEDPITTSTGNPIMWEPSSEYTDETATKKIPTVICGTGPFTMVMSLVVSVEVLWTLNIPDPAHQGGKYHARCAVFSQHESQFCPKLAPSWPTQIIIIDGW